MDQYYPHAPWGWNRAGLVSGNPPKRGDIVVSSTHLSFLWELDKFGNAIVLGGNHGGYEGHGGGVSFAEINRAEIEGYVPVPLDHAVIADWSHFYSYDR